MKIMIFCPGDLYSKPNPGFHLLTSLMNDILSAGHRIFYLGKSEIGLERHIPEELITNQNFSYSLIEKKRVNRANMIARYLKGILFAVSSRKIVKKEINECDVVYAVSNPAVLYNILVIRHYSKTIKIIYNVQDMFPGSTIASGKMQSVMLQKVFYALQRIAYSKADVITAISEDMKDKLIEQKVPEEKIKVIVNWFDDQSVREIPREDNLFIKKYNMQDDKFYVQYAGTMGYVFDYKMVLHVAELLKDQTDIVIQMIGAGSQKDVFMKEASELHLNNIVFLPLEPQEMVPHVYSACDICFIPLKKGIIGNSVPSKAGLLMACRRAIVTTADEGSDYNRMINDNHIGIACSTDSPSDAAKAIIKMKNDAAFREFCANSGHEYGKILYSRTENTTKYIKLFESLAEGK